MRTTTLQRRFERFAQLRAKHPDVDYDQIMDRILDEEAEAAEASFAVAAEREDEQTPFLESCDLWGTGEGRYHGVIA